MNVFIVIIKYVQQDMESNSFKVQKKKEKEKK